MAVAQKEMGAKNVLEEDAQCFCSGSRHQPCILCQFAMHDFKQEMEFSFDIGGSFGGNFLPVMN